MKHQIATIQLPLKNIMEARKIAIENSKALAALAEERRRLPSTCEEAVQMYGETYRDKYAELLADIEARRQTAIDAAKEKIAEQRKQAEQFNFMQIMPNGEDLLGDNAADVALFEHNVITTTAQLDAILAKHNNPAFRTMASNYADKKGWEGYSFIEKSQSAREFTAQVFNALATAAGHSTGPTYMQYCDTPGELSRIAVAHGLADEVAVSDGVSAFSE